MNIPAVQKYFGRQAAAALSEKFGTKVCVGRVDVGLFNRIIIDDVTMLDQQRHPMLRAGRISAKLDLLRLPHNEICITSAQLFGADIHINRATASAKPNYQFIVDSLASKDTTSHSKLNFQIHSLIIRHGAFCYDQLDMPNIHTFDLHHLHIQNISTHILLSDLTKEAGSINIKKLSLTEQCGLDIKELTAKASLLNHKITLDHLYLRTPTSKVSLKEIVADFRRNNDMIDWNTISYTGIVKPSMISTYDISCLTDKIKRSPNNIQLSTRVSGTRHHISIENILFDVFPNAARKSSILHFSGDIHTTLDDRQPVWSIICHSLYINKEGKNIFNINLPAVADRLDHLAFTGSGRGKGSKQIQVSGALLSDAGNAKVNFKMDHQTLDCYIETQRFNLQQITDNNDLGDLAASIKVAGNLHQKMFQVDGRIGRIDFKGYSYQHIDINGALKNETLSGHCSINDPNIVATIESKGGISLSRHHYVLNAEISRFRPSAINLLKGKLGDTNYAANISANISGSNLNNLDGLLKISSFKAQRSDETYELQSLQVKAGKSNNDHFVTMLSDFGHIEVTGQFDYATLLQSIQNVFVHQLPSIQTLTSFRYRPTHSNNFALTATILRDDWLRFFTGVDLNLLQPLSLTCSLDSKTETIDCHVVVPDLAYNGGHYQNVNVIATSPNNQLNCRGSLTKTDDRGLGTDYQLQATAVGNTLRTSLSMDNHAKKQRLRGLLNANMAFLTNEKKQVVATFDVKKSHLLVGDSVYTIHADQLTYSKKHLTIDNLNIASNSQSIRINGQASPNREDSIIVDLNNVNVEYILDLVNFHSVDFSGNVNGKAYLSSLFDTPKAKGNIMVSNFQFEEGKMGTLNANVKWNNEKKQIDIDALALDTMHTARGIQDRRTVINGFVSPKRNDINLTFNAINTRGEFLKGFCSNFMSNIDLSVNGKLSLWGDLKKINLTGAAKVSGATTITPINTRYYLADDSIRFLVNEIQFVDDTIHDRLGNRGLLTGALYHTHLSHLSYNLHVKANNLLGYELGPDNGNTVYGTIAGTGTVDINGKPGEVDIKVDATPSRGSVMCYDITSPEAIGTQEFIQWVSRDSLQAILPHALPPDNDTEPVDIPTDIHINFLIHATPDATLKIIMDKTSGDYIDFNGTGTIRASYYNKGGVNLYGNYVVDRGIYKLTIQNIIKRDFTFKQGGTITFGGDPGRANLNLEAQYMLNSVNLADLQLGRRFSGNNIRVNCLMKVTGTPTDPKVDFDMDMPTVSADVKQMIYSIINSEDEMKQQVLYLLAVGRFYNKTENNAQDMEAKESQTTLAMQSILSGQLSQQINNVLGSIVKNKNWNFGANISTGTEGWNNAEYEGILSGSLLNNRLLFNGQFGYRDNAATANQSFIGDFDIRYLIVPNGNLSVRIYNQTNDRYFTRNSLNTQGVGFVIKHDFDNWKELWHKKTWHKKK
ncbi:translocation/assembly module TamB domain-containing protein [Hallella mizrahii]|uniref:translocation/assembly module TamB domain-containing protein n=1 Tax=Hallella mizrahii TaxID=2606637 RepID=UPI001980C793